MKLGVAQVSVFGLLAVAVSAFGAETPRVLTLDEAKRAAISRNPEILALESGLEEARAQRKKANAPFYPKLGVGAGADTELAEDGVGTQPLAFVYGEWNLFRGFEDTYRTRIAGLEVDKASVRLEKARLRLALDVEAQYYLYVFKTLQKDLKSKAWEVNENHKKLARVRRASGLVSESDLLEYELRDSILRSDIAGLEQDRAQAKANLLRLLGEASQEADFAVQPDLGHWHVIGTLGEHVNRARAENEAMLIAQKELQVAELEKRQTGSKWFPELGLEVRAGRIPYGDRFESDRPAFRGTLILKMDLFSGFENVWQARENEMRKQKLERQLEAARLNSVTETEAAWRKIKATEMRVHLEERNEARARKYYDSVIGEYKRGVRNSTDVRSAAEILFDASARRQAYKYEFLTQKIELERAIGGPVALEAKPEKVSRLEEDHLDVDESKQVPEKIDRR